jgi:hypothetical protein
MKPSLIGIAAALVIGATAAHAQTLPTTEAQFQEMVAFLKSNDAERNNAIASCTAAGVGDNPTALAAFMNVPVDKAAATWCLRTVNGLANGALSFADLDAMNNGKITPAIRKAIKTP